MIEWLNNWLFDWSMPFSLYMGKSEICAIILSETFWFQVESFCDSKPNESDKPMSLLSFFLVKSIF